MHPRTPSGTASAALAAHVPANVIRALGRWDTDVYEIYTRSSREAAMRFGAVVASTAFTDFEGEFADEEFLLYIHILKEDERVTEVFFGAFSK